MPQVHQRDPPAATDGARVEAGTEPIGGAVRQCHPATLTAENRGRRAACGMVRVPIPPRQQDGPRDGFRQGSPTFLQPIQPIDESVMGRAPAAFLLRRWWLFTRIDLAGNVLQDRPGLVRDRIIYQLE